MSNLFFYTETRDNKEYTCSFNTDYIIRTVGVEDGKMVVLLDDIHEVIVPTQVVKGKNIGTEMRKQEVCSEIELSAEDTQRFLMYSGAGEFMNSGKEMVKAVETLS